MVALIGLFIFKPVKYDFALLGCARKILTSRPVSHKKCCLFFSRIIPITNVNFNNKFCINSANKQTPFLIKTFIFYLEKITNESLFLCVAVEMQ